MEDKLPDMECFLTMVLRRSGRENWAFNEHRPVFAGVLAALIMPCHAFVCFISHAGHVCSLGACGEYWTRSWGSGSHQPGTVFDTL
jgi:hypothetical protein